MAWGEKDVANVYRRGKTWWGRFTHEGQELRRSLGTTSSRVAEQRLLEWKRQVEQGQWARSRATYEEIALQFIERHFPRIKPSSRRRYRVSLQNLTPHFEHVPLAKITSASLSDFETARREEGVTPSTIRRDLMCLSSLFSFAREIEAYRGQNTVADYLRAARRRGLVENEPRSRYLSREEEERLLDYAGARRQTMKSSRDAHGWHMFQAAVAFAIDTGLRSNEQFSARWSQVDTARSEIHIPATKAKSGRGRTVPLLKRSLDAILALPRTDSGLIFWYAGGKRYRNMYQQFKRACRTLGLEDACWHDLRRTCGVRLLRDREVSIERVSLWLGHSSIGVTQKVYAFLEVDDLHKAVATSTGSQKERSTDCGQ